MAWRTRLAAALASLSLLAACAAQGNDLGSDMGYYWQSVRGHLGVLNAAQPVPTWLADPSTAAPLRERLLLAQRLRDYASAELALPDNTSYRRYADLQRPAVVWNVVAAPALSLQLKTWCFPLLGCVGYRGYFDRAEADRLAASLRAEGWEVSVYGVPAYSTLGKLPGGYFADPLLSTFIHWPEGELARLIFHELGHQVAYAGDDTGFNESFATAVEQVGSARWLGSRQATPGAAEADGLTQQRRQDFRALVGRFRVALEAVYRSDDSDAHKLERKATLMAELRAEHAAVKAQRWGGDARYDRWFAEANNATLGVQAAYHARVETFEYLFEQAGCHFEPWYTEVRRLAALDRTRREEALQALDLAARQALQNKQRDGVPVALSC